MLLRPRLVFKALTVVQKPHVQSLHTWAGFLYAAVTNSSEPDPVFARLPIVENNTNELFFNTVLPKIEVTLNEPYWQVRCWARMRHTFFCLSTAMCSCTQQVDDTPPVTQILTLKTSSSSNVVTSNGSLVLAASIKNPLEHVADLGTTVSWECRHPNSSICGFGVPFFPQSCAEATLEIPHKAFVPGHTFVLWCTFFSSALC